MWDYSLTERLQRIKQKKRELERIRKKALAKIRPSLRFIKLPCFVRFEHQFGEDTEFFPASIILHESNDKKLKMFCSVSLYSSQKIEVYLPVLGHLLIQADVEWCQLFTLSPKIFHKNPMYYRAEVGLNFNTESENLKFRKYLDELRTKHSVFLKAL